MVQGFARGIADFLCDRGVEAIVVACNTASAVALPQLEKRCTVPVWGVIDAGVEAATRATRSGHTGVIATRATIASQAYQRRLEERGMRVWARECPMLVHLVEEGLAESPEADVLTRHYLSGRPEIDTLILGCTHYPLLRAAIQRAAGPEVHLVDSAVVTAERVAAEMTNWGHGRTTFYATGDTKAFAHTAHLMGEAGDAVHAIELNAAA
jgi:glutamate racemase